VEALGQVAPVPATPDDHDLLIEIVQRQQGPASADIMWHWLRRQPGGFTLCRNAAGEIIGFVCLLEIAAATEAIAESIRRWLPP
jgi:hypothetical protein